MADPSALLHVRLHLLLSAYRNGRTNRVENLIVLQSSSRFLTLPFSCIRMGSGQHRMHLCLGYFWPSALMLLALIAPFSIAFCT